MWLPITLGESLGRGHFYLAETRTFLLCVDTSLPLEADPLTPSEKASSRETGFEEIQSECGSQGFHFPPSELIGSWRAISSDFRTRDASAKSVSSRRMIGHTTSGESS